MSQFSGRKNLVISLGMVLFMYAGTSMSSAAAVEWYPFRGSSQEEMVEMAGYGEKKLSTVLVTGSVVCEECLLGDNQLRAWQIAGALVGVNCRAEGKGGRPTRTRGVTDEDGNFTIDLPSHLHAISNLQEKCCVELLRMPRNSPCRPAHVRTHEAIRLSSVGSGIRTYTAGEIKLLHSASKHTEACVKQEQSNMERSW